MSALFFLSAFLAVFSPLPILILGLASEGKGRAWAWAACVSNAALVYIFGGDSSLAAYGVFVVASSLTLVEILGRKSAKAASSTPSPLRLEYVGGAALLAMAAAGGIAIAFYSRVIHVHPWNEMKTALSQFVDYWVKTASVQTQDPAEIETWKQSLIVEMPSAIAVLGLIVVWANLTAVLRMNPGGIRSRIGLRPDFFDHWKAPEWLIWPTIVAGATLLLDLGHITDLGRNLFKFLMAIYAIQGLSILSFFFGYWKLKRGFRVLGYVMAVMVLMPLLLSLGFFDLWFDFRAKFRQS